MRQASTRALPLEDRKPVTAADLRALLRRKFPSDQFAMLYEVRDAAGHHASRSADVVMVGLWPSRGNQIEGMEIKVSRGDWLRELARPEKGEAFVRFCDRWWVVAAHEDIVEDHELPRTWGLMVAGGRGLQIAKPAPALKAKPLDRSFLAAMLKRATMTSLDRPEVKAAIESAVNSAREATAATVKYEAGEAGRELERLRRQVTDFEAASGVVIQHWMAGNIGDAVKLVLEGRVEQRRRDLQQLKDQARRILERITEVLPDEPAEAVDAGPG